MTSLKAPATADEGALHGSAEANFPHLPLDAVFQVAQPLGGPGGGRTGSWSSGLGARSAEQALRAAGPVTPAGAAFLVLIRAEAP